MSAFEPIKELKETYEDLKYRRRRCIDRAEQLIRYLKTQDQNTWRASIKELNRQIRAAKKDMPSKDW